MQYKQYKFNWDYKSDAGTWPKGEVADFEAEFAEWLNRDSPGVVSVYTAPKKRQRKTAKNRMVTKAEDRSISDG